MRLLGRANWWAPGPLHHLYARYGQDGALPAQARSNRGFSRRRTRRNVELWTASRSAVSTQSTSPRRMSGCSPRSPACRRARMSCPGSWPIRASSKPSSARRRPHPVRPFWPHRFWLSPSLCIARPRISPPRDTCRNGPWRGSGYRCSTPPTCAIFSARPRGGSSSLSCSTPSRGWPAAGTGSASAGGRRPGGSASSIPSAWPGCWTPPRKSRGPVSTGGWATWRCSCPGSSRTT